MAVYFYVELWLEQKYNIVGTIWPILYKDIDNGARYYGWENKNEHYVPQRYLKHFANGEPFFVFDKEKTEKRPGNVGD